MSGGPNREWKQGDHGPDYHVESATRMRHGSLFARPRASDNGGSFVVGGIQCGHQRADFKPPQGRDQNDMRTLEMPLEPPELDIRLKLELRAAKVLFETGNVMLAWELLFSWAYNNVMEIQ